MSAISNSPSELLEQLAFLCHCTYLSDLPRLSKPNHWVTAALFSIPTGAYTGRCWREALTYLTGSTDIGQTDGRECRRRLLEFYGSDRQNQMGRIHFSPLDTCPA